MDERRRQSMTVSAKTVAEAIAEAERELGVPRDALDITVITEGSKGFLGMRAENARILAMVVSPPATNAAPMTAARDVQPDAAPLTTASPAPAPDATSEPVRAPRSRGRAVVKPPPVDDQDGRNERNERPQGEDDAGFGEERYFDEAEAAGDFDAADDAGAAEQGAAPGGRAQQRQETARMAQEILETLLRQMDMDARVRVRSTSDPIILDVETDNGGLLIGRRGETLSALQYLVNVLIGRRTRGWTKVVIDVEGWRSRREETLRSLALRQADRVRREQRPIALDPMPANERRIVHMALQDMADIATHSEGEEPGRRLVITLKR